jgi:hypothetical protein
MLETFLQSLVLGTLLATAFFLMNGVLRRISQRRLGALSDDTPLRCVQPLDVIGH